jgi:hypothetical protein
MLDPTIHRNILRGLLGVRRSGRSVAGRGMRAARYCERCPALCETDAAGRDRSSLPASQRPPHPRERRRREREIGDRETRTRGIHQARLGVLPQDCVEVEVRYGEARVARFGLDAGWETCWGPGRNPALFLFIASVQAPPGLNAGQNAEDGARAIAPRSADVARPSSADVARPSMESRRKWSGDAWSAGARPVALLPQLISIPRGSEHRGSEHLVEHSRPSPVAQHGERRL